MSKIELGRYTYGYYRVMELLAWTYCARAVAFFNDLPALLMVLGTLILFEAFRMWSERRDIKNAITASNAELTRKKSKDLIEGCLDWASSILRRSQQPQHICKHDKQVEGCYSCDFAEIQRYIHAARQENKK